MTSLQRVVSVILFSVGGLLGLLGLFGLLVTPPAGVSPGIHQMMQGIFAVGGVVGMGLVAAGAFLRTRTMSRRSVAILWIIYGLFWLILIGLTLFSWASVSQAALLASSGRRSIFSLVYLFGFLAAPLIELLARRRVRTDNAGANRSIKQSPILPGDQSPSAPS